MIEHLAIIGGGFSGTLQAVNLLRHDGPRATLIERRARAGQGLAYGAAHPSHLLNVRAANMSAFPDDPRHFVRWLAGRGVADAASAFVPRLTYGAYLRDLLDAACARGGDRLRIVTADVVDVVQDLATRVVLDDGATITADAAVLAVGNLPPHDPAGLSPAVLVSEGYAADPWSPAALEGLGADAIVLVLGTGLTMVDVVLSLSARGFAGRIVALSRRGLVPHAHMAGAPAEPLRERPAGPASHLVRAVRARAAGTGWRAAVDALRPYTQDMWAAASDAERERFLRHLRPWWDVHRHRLAPQVAERIAAMQTGGRLTIVAGKLASAEPDEGAVAVRYRPRGNDAPVALRVTRIVNCTGPQGDLLRTEEPLLRRLVARGTLRPDAARLGIDVDGQSRTIAADGDANDWLLALGPMTRGAFWEIVAVPDIRVQSWTLARRLSNAHWVGGEGL